MQHVRRCSRTRGADVSFRDVTIETPDRECDQGMWMTSCTGSLRGGFGGFEKISVSGVLAPEEGGWLSELAEALQRVPHVVWDSIGRWYISPYVEKTLNSKVIKSFVPELRSRKCFSCFGIPMLSIYVRYGHYEGFAYRYEYVYITYSCMGILQSDVSNNPPSALLSTHKIKGNSNRTEEIWITVIFSRLQYP